VGDAIVFKGEDIEVEKVEDGIDRDGLFEGAVSGISPHTNCTISSIDNGPSKSHPFDVRLE
jgi:hypothetical protein